MLDPFQALNEAADMQRKGDLAAAERLYLQLLGAQPDHFDALQMLGFLRYQQGRYMDALPLMAAAVKVDPSSATALLNHAVVLDALHRREEALAIYDKALEIKPGYAEALFNRGIALRDLKRPAEALATFDQLLAVAPDDADALNNRGNALRDLHRCAEALASYDRALAIKPNNPDVLNNRGNALRDLDRIAEALASYDEALASRPNYVEALNNRGSVLRNLKRPAEALASFDRALAIKPHDAGILYNRGNALQDLERPAEALASFDRALAITPGNPDVLNNRGNALRALLRPAEALVSFDKALAIRPDYVEALNNRGGALQDSKRSAEALRSYDKAIALKPDYAEAYHNRVSALYELKRFEEALASADKAIALKPDYAEAFNSRGHLLKDEGKWAAAVVSFERALALKRDYADAKVALCMAQIPILYRDEPEIAQQRAAYQECLETLHCDVDGRRMLPHELARAVGSSQPFYLAYQGYNDRDLQSRYGSLVCRIMSERYPPAALSPPPGPDEPVRLGIVSGFFCRHSNWKIPIKGWLSQLDRRWFRVSGYHTGVIEDAETKQAAALCDRFVQGPLSMDRWRKTIQDDAPHVLIYPEVGMDAVSAQLAAQRLAPVQCNSWGHPDTSGFPTLDYYLSSELMEPPDAQDHYSEVLVRLPNLSIYYEPLYSHPVSLHRTDLGFRSTATVFWCGQSLYKYLPQFDPVFPRIAREVRDCQFVFIRYDQGSYLNELFSRRLNQAFAAFGLRAEDHCVLLPHLETPRFLAAIGQCDIVLDSIGWSGCNSTLEALHRDLPVVTMTGSLMRGRHSMAILKMMGIDETITETVDAYVSTAIRLGQDLAWRRAVKKRISENKHRVYCDATCVSALQRFLDGVARRAVH
jgi:protein O-GlcNAc transferase